MIRVTVRNDHHVDGTEAVEVERALRARNDHPALEGIPQNRIHQDSHRTRLDQNRGVSEKRDFHGCPRPAEAQPDAPAPWIASSVSREARDQLPQALAPAFANRGSIADEQRIEVELEQAPYALAQAFGVVHDSLAQ